MLPIDRSSGSRRVCRVRDDRGYTMVELMITLAVLAILLVMAVPSFTSIINTNRLTGQANELVADLQFARAEAIRRNQRVTFCPSTNNTSCAAAGNWANRIITAPTAAGGTEVIRVSAAKPPVQLSGGGTTTIVFRPDGMSRDAAGNLLNATLTVCQPTSTPAENIRSVQLAAGARVSITSGTFSTPGSCPSGP